jgi:hypothetical protein
MVMTKEDNQRIVAKINDELCEQGEENIWLQSPRIVVIRTDVGERKVKRNGIKYFLDTQACNISSGIRILPALPHDIVGDWRPVTEIADMVRYLFDRYDTIKEGQRKV